MGLSDREACIYADIAVSTLYDYCKKHKEFSERKEGGVPKRYLRGVTKRYPISLKP